MAHGQRLSSGNLKTVPRGRLFNGLLTSFSGTLPGFVNHRGTRDGGGGVACTCHGGASQGDTDGWDTGSPKARGRPGSLQVPEACAHVVGYNRLHNHMRAHPGGVDYRKVTQANPIQEETKCHSDV